MILKQLKILNFISHSNTTIDFKPKQKTLLAGKSGSGKTSIVEAIVWALYNKNRSSNLSIIKKGTKNASVTVILQDKEKDYKISRTIDDKNKHELKVSEKEEGKKFIPIKAQGTREMQEYIEKNILHASYLLFVNSIISPQNSTEDFVSQTATRKKDILLEIVKASDYDNYLKKTKEELSKIKTDKEVLLSKIEGRQDEIKNNQETADKLKDYENEEIRLKEEIANLKKEYEELTNKQKEIMEKMAALKSKEENIETKVKDYDAKNEKIENLNKKIIELSSVDIEGLKKEIEILNEKKKELDEYNITKDKMLEWNNKHMEILKLMPVQHDYDGDKAEINRQLISIIGTKLGQCPKCGYIDPEQEKKKQEGIKTLESRLNTVQLSQSTYNESLAGYNKQIEGLGSPPILNLITEQYTSLLTDLKDFDELNRKLINAENINKEIESAGNEIKIIKTEQESISKEIEEIKMEISRKNELYDKERDIKEKIIKINGKLDDLMIAHTSNSELLGVAKHAVEKIKKSEVELNTLRKELEKNSEDIEALNLIKDAFGPNGIKAIMIDYILPELEDRINAILSKLSDFRIELTTQKSGTGKDVLLEGLFIVITNAEGEQLDFNNYSGGERIKVTTAISEALASLSKCNFRILDEAVVALDEESVEQFIEAISEIQKKVSQVLCISHIDSIKNLFEERINIVKQNGNSKING
jgi:exonuclease SbcC